MENPRVRVCFDCHEYHSVNVTNYKAIESLHQFEAKHRGHRTQIVNLKELKSESTTNQDYHQV
ncbi:MAG: hypothetical protein ACFE8M_11770 [Candidatus Hermodarchaeota archaeon]